MIKIKKSELDKGIQLLEQIINVSDYKDYSLTCISFNGCNNMLSMIGATFWTIVEYKCFYLGEDFKCLIHLSDFKKVLALFEDEIMMEFEDNNCILTEKNTKHIVSLYKHERYPYSEFDYPPNTCKEVVLTKQMANAFKKASSFTGYADNLPLERVLVMMSKNLLKIRATNRFIMFFESYDISTDFDLEILIPSEDACLFADQSKLKLYDHEYVLEGSQFKVRGKIFKNEKFPDCDEVIPQSDSYSARVKVNKSVILESLDKLEFAINTPEYNFQLDFSDSSGNLSISMKRFDYTVFEIIVNARLTGDLAPFSLNRSMFRKVIDSFENEGLCMNLTDNNKGIVITANKENRLIMPLMTFE